MKKTSQGNLKILYLKPLIFLLIFVFSFQTMASTCLPNIQSLLTDSINIEPETRHLSLLSQKYQGSLVSVAAAYNAGETALNHWRKKFSQHKELEFIENIPYKETNKYVKLIIRNTIIYDFIYEFDASKNLRLP